MIDHLIKNIAQNSKNGHKTHMSYSDEDDLTKLTTVWQQYDNSMTLLSNNRRNEIKVRLFTETNVFYLSF